MTKGRLLNSLSDDIKKYSAWYTYYTFDIGTTGPKAILTVNNLVMFYCADFLHHVKAVQ